MMEVDQGHLLLAILQQKDSLKDTSYFGLSWCGPQPARDEVLSRLLKGNFKEDEETTNPCTLEPALVESLCEGLSLDWCSRSQTFHMVCQGVQPPSGLASCQTQGVVLPLRTSRNVLCHFHTQTDPRGIQWDQSMVRQVRHPDDTPSPEAESRWTGTCHSDCHWVESAEHYSEHHKTTHKTMFRALSRAYSRALSRAYLTVYLSASGSFPPRPSMRHTLRQTMRH